MHKRMAAILLTTFLLPIGPLAQSKPAVPNITGTWAGSCPSCGNEKDIAVLDRSNPKLVPPPGPLLLKPQYKGPYEARKALEKQASDRGEPLGNPHTLCAPYGMPAMMVGVYPMEILQTPGQITILKEEFSEVRRIYLDEPQGKIGEVEPSYYGHAVGRWEGDTLVVDTIGVSKSVPGHENMPHSDQMRITERFRIVAPGILHDQITVEDPMVLEKPWTFTFVYRRMPHYRMAEYICENNRAVIDDKGVIQLKLR